MRFFLGVLTLIAVALFSGTALVGWGLYETFFISPDTERSVEFVIESGEGVNQISQNLKDKELIRSMFLFESYVWLLRAGGDLKAGDYILHPKTSLAELVDTLITGGVKDEVSVTIPEGFTLVQIGERLEQSLGIPQSEWSKAVGVNSPLEDNSFVKSSMKPDGVDLEGYLFPDTYRFSLDATALDVAEKMLAEMESRLSELDIVFADTEDTESINSIHKLLTLASIIEREVRTDEDRAKVSGIFYNRLESGMALQADSTVNYITGKKTPGISLEDRDIDSPYNTYQNTGLPPGPIASSGLASIKAAVAPEQTDYYYFLTTNNGKVIYAQTHDQHVQNKVIYR